MPDDAPRFVATERREDPAVVAADVGEAAENPCRDGNHVAGAADQLAIVAIVAPAEQPFAAKDHEDLGRIMDMQIVGDAIRHFGDADGKAVRFADVDDLIGRLRHAGTDDRIIALGGRSRQLAIDESHLARHHVLAADKPRRGQAGSGRAVGAWRSSSQRGLHGSHSPKVRSANLAVHTDARNISLTGCAAPCIAL